MSKTSSTATSWLAFAGDGLDSISIADLQVTVADLVLSESEVDDLCDPFTDRWVDVERSGIGRPDVGAVDNDEAQELFA